MIRPQAGDVDIVPAIIIVIADCYSHAPPNIADTGLVCDVGKCAIAVIVIKSAARLLL